MDHDPLAEGRLRLGDGGTAGGDDATGLVAANDGTHVQAGCPVRREVTAAHTRSLDLNDHVTRSWYRIGKLPQFELAIAKKNDSPHRVLLVLALSAGWGEYRRMSEVSL
jgi:hypothetical protein